MYPRSSGIALKDNVCLAGVPMMNGASTLEGYVSDVGRESVNINPGLDTLAEPR